MKIRKYLCETFDIEEKGYVTVYDIYYKLTYPENIIKALFAMTIIVVLTILICLTGDIYNFGIVTDDKRDFMDLFTFSNFIAGTIFWFLVIMSIKIIQKIWNKIKTFKVVVCPLKKV